MRYLIFLFFSFISIFLFAQDDAFSPKAGGGFHVSKEAIGGFGEFFIKPKTSVWVSAGVRFTNAQLGFGVDTTNEFGFPQEIDKYNLAQSNTSIRSGVRFYVPFGNSKWTFHYSPFVGFLNRSATSDEYAADIARADINPSYLEFPLSDKAQHLEVGAGVGLRWRFARSFYVEGAVLGYQKIALLDDQHVLEMDGTLGLGYLF